MKRNSIIKKILSSLCVLSMAAAPLSAMAADNVPQEDREIYASFVYYNMDLNHLQYYLGSNTDGDRYTITGGGYIGDEIMVEESGGFGVSYKIRGEALGNKPKFFYMTVACRDQNNNVVDQKRIRTQYFMRGDVNCDGKIDMDDIGVLHEFMRSDLNECIDAMYWNDSILELMDFNYDGVIDMQDSYTLLSYIDGNEPESSSQIGTMKWVTVNPEDAQILDMPEAGGWYMEITKGDGAEDWVFNLYD